MHLVINAQGTVRCLYGEAIELDTLGRPAICRASRVEPTDDGRWVADLSPVGTQARLGPFRRRSDALQAERDWLESHWLLGTRDG